MRNGIASLFYAVCIVNSSFAWWIILAAICYKALVRFWLGLQIVAFYIGG